MISRRECLVRIAVLLLAPVALSRPAGWERVLCDEAGFPLVTETGELIGC
jgi:hypothetical protein